MDDQISASTRHVLYAVRVIVERQPLDNPWVSHKWAVHDLIPLDISAGLGALPSGDIILQPLHADSSELDLYMADIRIDLHHACLLYTSPSPRDRTRSRMPSSA